jgi:hypothetical protein
MGATWTLLLFTAGRRSLFCRYRSNRERLFVAADGLPGLLSDCCRMRGGLASCTPDQLVRSSVLVISDKLSHRLHGNEAAETMPVILQNVTTSTVE